MVSPRAFFRHRIAFLFATFVCLPTLLAALYYAFIAQDMYVSSAKFIIRSPSQTAMPTSGLASLLQSQGSTPQREQTEAVIAFLRSRDAVSQLQKELNLRIMYRGSTADLLTRYPAPFTKLGMDSFFKYYQSVVIIENNEQTGITDINVKAFRAEDAQNINNRLLIMGEAFVNNINSRAGQKAIIEAQQRVNLASERLAKARMRLASLRKVDQMLDPSRQAAAEIDLSSKLSVEAMTIRSQLSTMESQTPRNPAISVLKSRLHSIDAMQSLQQGRLTGTSKAIAAKLPDYETMTNEQEFAVQALTAANLALEQARVEARKQQFYLDRIVSPNRPDIASYPKAFKSVVVIFMILSCLYFVSWMIITGIMEHAPE